MGPHSPQAIFKRLVERLGEVEGAAGSTEAGSSGVDADAATFARVHMLTVLSHDVAKAGELLAKLGATAPALSLLQRWVQTHCGEGGGSGGGGALARPVQVPKWVDSVLLLLDQQSGWQPASVAPAALPPARTGTTAGPTTVTELLLQQAAEAEAAVARADAEAATLFAAVRAAGMGQDDAMPTASLEPPAAAAAAAAVGEAAAASDAAACNGGEPPAGGAAQQPPAVEEEQLSDPIQRAVAAVTKQWRVGGMLRKEQQIVSGKLWVCGCGCGGGGAAIQKPLAQAGRCAASILFGVTCLFPQEDLSLVLV